jgi:hypothetical protein
VGSFAIAVKHYQLIVANGISFLLAGDRYKPDMGCAENPTPVGSTCQLSICAKPRTSAITSPRCSATSLPPAVGSSDGDDVAVTAEGAMYYLRVPGEFRRKSIAAAAQFVAIDFLGGTEQPQPLA